VLIINDFETDLPFAPRREFYVRGVSQGNVRGAHAHKTCHQFMICVNGACSVSLDDGARRSEVRLESASMGLHVQPGVWSMQFNHTPDAVLIVLASHPYDADDYLHDYSAFIAWTQRAVS
jgi:UDP-2-acetamido-3-amino-2,3-dideoxy-glucuronate N-acetyltransferase